MVYVLFPIQTPNTNNNFVQPQHNVIKHLGIICTHPESFIE